MTRTGTWQVRPVGGHADSLDGKRWHLDLPRSGDAVDQSRNRTRIRGWVLPSTDGPAQVAVRVAGKLSSHALNRPRLDIVGLLLNRDSVESPHLVSGFDLEVEAGVGAIEVGIQYGDTVHWAWNLNRGEGTVSKVEEGRAGWLFLNNDTNRSIEQYTGRLLMEAQQLAAWSEYFASVSAMAYRGSFEWLFVVAPAKEFVFPDFYPHAAGRSTPVDQFLIDVEHDGRVLWPLSGLSEHRELSYWKGDTHWTDYGAGIVAEMVLRQFGHDAASLFANERFHRANRAGDLGGKCSPKRTFSLLEAAFLGAKRGLVYDNGIHNHGRMRIYQTPDAASDGTCMVFGDSFSVNLVPWLVPFYRRVVSVHSAGAADVQLIEAERPCAVVLQSNSRFLMTPLRSDFRNGPIVLRKLLAMTVQDRHTLRQSLLAQSAAGALKRREEMLVLLERAESGMTTEAS